MHLPQAFDEEGGRPGLKPVGIEFPVRKSVQEAVGIIDSLGILVKAVPVVSPAKLFQALLCREALFIRQLSDLRKKSLPHFLIRDSTYIRVFRIHGNISELVQITENTDLAELGHSCDKDKSNVSFVAFE